MLIVIALILVLAFSFFITAMFRHRSRISFLLSLYLLGMADVVLVSEIAGLFSQLNSQIFFIGAHLFLDIIAAIIWFLNGRPPIFHFTKIEDVVAKATESIKKDYFLWILGLSVVVGYSINAVLIFFVHANTNDSLAVHLARIGYWLQSGSFKPWATENTYQISYPINAQAQMLWTVLLSGTDQLVEFIQWFSAVFAAVAIVGIGKFFGFTKQQRVFSGLIWATLPLVFLQSTTTQNDLISASLVIIGVYFLYCGIKNYDISAVVLSSIALGFSLGIKQTSFFIIPGLALSLFLVLLKYKKRILKLLLIFTVGCILSSLVLGSYLYISNFIYFGNPFGPSEFVDQNLHYDDSSISQALIINTSRYFYQSIDPTGIPETFKDNFTNLKQSIFSKIFSTLNIPVESDENIGRNPFLLSSYPIVHEDTAWFGLLGFLLLFLTMIEVIRSIKKRNFYSFGIFMIAFGAFLSIIIFRTNWTPYQGRYMIISFTILSPFFGSVYPNKYSNKHSLKYWARRVLVFCFVVVAIIGMVTVLFNNAGKPLRNYSQLFTGDRLIHYKYQGGYLVKVIAFADKTVPHDATLGLAIGRSWEYPYFREDFTRTLVPIYPTSNLFALDWLSDKEVEYVLIDRSKFENFYVPEFCEEVGSFDNFIVLEIIDQ
jgi:hypothetical protein